MILLFNKVSITSFPGMVIFAEDGEIHLRQLTTPLKVGVLISKKVAFPELTDMVLSKIQYQLKQNLDWIDVDEIHDDIVAIVDLINSTPLEIFAGKERAIFEYNPTALALKRKITQPPFNANTDYLIDKFFDQAKEIYSLLYQNDPRLDNG